MAKELIYRQTDVFRDLAEQDRRDVATLVKGHGRTPAFLITELLVRTTLSDFRETECCKDCDDLTRFEDRDISHLLGHGDGLDTYKLRLKLWLAILKQHGYDLLEVAIQFVQRLTLRMSTREPRDKPDE